MVRDPAADGLYVTEQAANPAAVGASVHLDERNVPAPLDAKLTVPVGLDAFTPFFTVAVHVVADPAATRDGEQVTDVDVAVA